MNESELMKAIVAVRRTRKQSAEIRHANAQNEVRRSRTALAKAEQTLVQKDRELVTYAHRRFLELQRDESASNHFLALSVSIFRKRRESVGARIRVKREKQILADREFELSDAQHQIRSATKRFDVVDGLHRDFQAEQALIAEDETEQEIAEIYRSPDTHV